MHILIFEQQEIHTEAIELLKKEATLQLYYSDQDSYDKEKIQAIFMRSGTQASADFLKDFPNLQYILRVGVGLDNIDTSYCKEQNIQIFNSPGSNANAVAEYVLGQMINLARNIPAAISDTKKGNYDRFQFMGTELSGKTLGIIGCGAIGTFLAKKAHACDMNIIGYDPFVDAQTLQQRNIQKAELEDIYKHSDFITLHLPLIPQTENMIHREVFKQMKNTAYLINAARGGIVHEKELLKVLENREIAGAAVDVYETEPKLPQELISHPSMLPTPHIAAMTEEAHKNMAIMPAKKLIHTIQEEQEILFVCMGNSERSAIAETLYNKLSQTHRAYSAGTNVTTSPRNSHIYEILQEENIDIQNKQKQQLNEELFNHATKVYVLCDKKHCPEYVINSKKVIYWDVKDPYDEDKSFLSMTRDIIKKHIEEIL